MDAVPVAAVSVEADAKKRRLNSLVLQAGAASTAVTLFLVYLLDKYGHQNIMGWTADYVIPAGAILVGAVASSGYGLASWFGGLKIQKKLMYTIIGLQIAAYFAAKYLEFQNLGPLTHRATGLPVGFFEYFHYTAVNLAFEDHGKIGAALGYWGYGVRALEIAGFAVGSLLVPGILWQTPYCDTCQMYKKTRSLALFPASVPVKKIKKNDAEGLAAYQKEQSEMFEKSKAHVEFLAKCAAENNPDGFHTYVNAAAQHKKETGKLPGRVEVSLIHCKSCSAGHLNIGLLTGHGKQQKRHPWPSVELKPEFVAAIRDAKKV
jgi:hypothetical protein